MNASDFAALQSLLTNARSSENELRNTAEKAIHTHLTHNPSPFLIGLTQVMHHASDVEMRAFCAIILRKKLTIGEPTLYDTLSDEAQTELKNALLQLLARESNAYVRRQIGDAVAELATVLLYKDGWPEFIPFISRMMQESDPAIRVLGLWMLGKLTDAIDSLQNYLPIISPLIALSLQDSNVDVQVESIKTLCQLIVILEDEKMIKEHAKAFPVILPLIEQWVIQGNEEAALSVLTAMVDLVQERNGLLFKPCLDRFGLLLMLFVTAGTPMFTSLPTIIHANMFQPFQALITEKTARPSSLSLELRHMSMELLLSFCEDAPRLVRRSRTLITACVISCFTFMLSVDGVSLAEWAQQDEDDEEDSFTVGEMGAYRLADSIKGDKLTPIIGPFFTQLLTVDAWQYQHAALRTIAAIGIVLPFEQLPIASVVAHLAHPHPRVRYGAVHCIAQWATEFRPHLPELNHASLFPALLPPLIDSSYPRLQSHAAFCLMHLCDELDESIMGLYAGSLLECLLTLLTNSSNSQVQEQVMSTVAAIATSSPTVFQSSGQPGSPSFYERVLTLMKHVITEAKGVQHAMLRAKAMESITVVGMNVPKELFYNDAIQLMHIFLEWMNADAADQSQSSNSSVSRMGLEADDVSEQYMIQAWQRICTVLGEEFTPMLPHLLPKVFAAANQHINISAIADADDESVISELRSLSTSQIEEKIQALAALNSFTHDLQTGMFPFIRECASIVVPLLTYSINEEVRMYSISLMPLIVGCLVQGYHNKACDLVTVSASVAELVHAQLTACKSEQEIELLISLVKSLQECVRHIRDFGIAQSVIDNEGLSVIANTMINMLAASEKRIISKEQAMEREEEDEDGMDEEIMQDMELAIQQEDSLYLTIAECMGTLIQSHQRAFVPTFIQLLPVLQKMMSSASMRERRVAVFLFDDLVENADITDCAQQLFSIFLPVLLQHVGMYSDEAGTTENEGPLRQACAYGIGLCAANLPGSFEPWAEAAIQRMMPLVQQRIKSTSEGDVGEDDETHVGDIDNCVSAFGKIALLSPDAKRPNFRPHERYLEVFIRALPIIDDMEEAEKVNRVLLQLIETGHPVIQHHQPHVLFVLSCLLNSQGINEEINTRIKHWLAIWKHQPNLEATTKLLSHDQINKVRQSLAAVA